MGDRSVWITVEEFQHETGNAILITPVDWEDEKGGTKVWIPLSQVDQIERSDTTPGGRILVREWMAKKKGLV